MPYYWNSTFSIKPGAKGLKSTKRMKRTAIKGSRQPLNKVGPRTKKWRSAWRFLKPELAAHCTLERLGGLGWRIVWNEPTANAQKQQAGESETHAEPTTTYYHA